jgi:hypothetical protein
LKRGAKSLYLGKGEVNERRRLRGLGPEEFSDLLISQPRLIDPSRDSLLNDPPIHRMLLHKTPVTVDLPSFLLNRGTDTANRSNLTRHVWKTPKAGDYTLSSSLPAAQTPLIYQRDATTRQTN